MKQAKVIGYVIGLGFLVFVWGCQTSQKAGTGGGLAMAQAGSQSSWNADQKAIAGLIERFSKAVDRRDMTASKETQHKHTGHYFVMGPKAKKLGYLNRSVYLKLLKAKKIGGKKRKLKVHWVAVSGQIGVAKATMIGKKAKFTNFISFAKVQGTWHMTSLTMTLGKP